MRIREYPLPYLLLGGALSSVTALARTKALGDAWIDDPDALRLYNAIESGEKLRVREWLEHHACPMSQTTAWESVMAWAEKLVKESKRDRLLAELQGKSLAELEALVEGRPATLPMRKEA